MSRDIKNKTLDLWAKKAHLWKKNFFIIAAETEVPVAEGELITLSIRADRISTN